MKGIYKIEVYVPEEHCELLKSKLFEAGAGKIGDYDCCAWQTSSGVGQFRPLENSNPFIGKIGEIEKVNEIKIELVCKKEYLEAAIKAIKKYHPYETPAFQYWEVNS